jgi:hypothetical protein
MVTCQGWSRRHRKRQQRAYGFFVRRHVLNMSYMCRGVAGHRTRRGAFLLAPQTVRMSDYGFYDVRPMAFCAQLAKQFYI